MEFNMDDSLKQELKQIIFEALNQPRIDTKYLGQSDAARYLGMSVPTFISEVQNHVRYAKIGKKRYYSIESLDNFVEERLEGSNFNAKEEALRILRSR